MLSPPPPPARCKLATPALCPGQAKYRAGYFDSTLDVARRVLQKALWVRLRVSLRVSLSEGDLGDSVRVCVTGPASDLWTLAPGFGRCVVCTSGGVPPRRSGSGKPGDLDKPRQLGDFDKIVWRSFLSAGAGTSGLGDLELRSFEAWPIVEVHLRIVRAVARVVCVRFLTSRKSVPERERSIHTALSLWVRGSFGPPDSNRLAEAVFTPTCSQQAVCSNLAGPERFSQHLRIRAPFVVNPTLHLAGIVRRYRPILVDDAPKFPNSVDTSRDQVWSVCADVGWISTQHEPALRNRTG